jgi:hypothetical protein
LLGHDGPGLSIPQDVGALELVRIAVRRESNTDLHVDAHAEGVVELEGAGRPCRRGGSNRSEI